MRRFLAVGAALSCLALGRAALAEEGTPDTEGKKAPREGGGLLAGVKGGGIVPFGGLSPNATVGIELGYVLPFMHRSFALAVDLDYAAPKKSGEEQDPRIQGGKYTWHLTEQELNLMPLAMYRLTSLGKVTPFIGIGPRIYFLRSTVRSNEGTPQFGETTEKSTKVGLGIPFGIEYQLGPGGLLAEFLFQYGGINHMATGSSNTGAISLGLGYRLLI